MVQYDPDILQRFAERMYSRAKSIIAVWGLLGFILGCVTGGILGAAMERPLQYFEIGLKVVIVSGGLLGLVFGVLIGLEKAFWLKLEAQKVLCQLQVESNTRPSSEPPATAKP